MAQGVEVGGDGDPGPGAVGVGGQVGGQGVGGGGDQGVPEPGAVVAGVDVLLAGVRVQGRCRGGEREQRGPQGGGVLDGAPAADPDPAGAVLGDREVAAQVGGPVALLELLLGVAVGPLGIGHREQVPRGLGEVGGVEPGRLVEEQGLGPPAQLGLVREPVDRVGDHGRLLGRHPARRQRGVGGGAARRPAGRPGARCGARSSGGCRPGG